LTYPRVGQIRIGVVGEYCHICVAMHDLLGVHRQCNEGVELRPCEGSGAIHVSCDTRCLNHVRSLGLCLQAASPTKQLLRGKESRRLAITAFITLCSKWCVFFSRTIGIVRSCPTAGWKQSTTQLPQVDDLRIGCSSTGRAHAASGGKLRAQAGVRSPRLWTG
jgi:hypothetical protein